MNQAFQDFISNTDDPYNFVAFTADKIDTVTPYLAQAYSSIVLFFTSYSLEIQLIMITSTVLSILGIAYIFYRLSNTTKKHRKLHLHEFAGFEHKKNK